MAGQNGTCVRSCKRFKLEEKRDGLDLPEAITSFDVASYEAHAYEAQAYRL